MADQVVGQDLIVNGTSTDISVDCNSYLDENPGFSWQWDYALNSAGSANTSWVSRKYLANLEVRRRGRGRDD